ncbi:rod shape-determining protein MreC [Kamptonema cortianum]|nr:rod shape-determining protein MreC [Geitlerinema splendidum]MDK3156986.1 rod shape-determining protein MreC [Kamptonema cortianum]
MMHYLDSAESLNNQIRQLRELLEFESPGRTKIPADIIEYVPYDNRITINAGENKGIKPNLPVISGPGLLGVVSTVDKTTSQVLLITSTSVKIGGLVIGSPNVPGIVQGQSMRRLVMDITVSDDVVTGAAVMTTGYSQFIPRGIRIGTVIESYRDEDSGVRRAIILPAATIGVSKEVVVLK